jgi:ribosomal protein L7/L12
MQIDIVGIALGLVVLGFLIGRLTAPKEKTTTVFQPVARRIDIGAADPEIETAIRSGHKIEAIKRYREIYGTDLKDAKDAVDAIEARLQP